MSEYFILVNETQRQFIDPDDFPTRLGIKHAAWMAEAHNCVPVYLLTDTEFDMFSDYETGAWCGAWAGDAIRLVGDTNDDYRAIIDTYENVSAAVFEDIAGFYTWFPGADHLDDVEHPTEPSRNRE